MGVGRPTSYKPEYCREAELLCLLGLTDVELAEFFQVSDETIRTWKHKYPEFLGAIENGRILPDAQAAQTLFKLAMGFEHKVEDIVWRNGAPIKISYTKYFPPNFSALSLWLRNRRPDQWRDKHTIGVEMEKLTDDQVNEMYNKVIAHMSKPKELQNIDAETIEIQTDDNDE